MRELYELPELVAGFLRAQGVAAKARFCGEPWRTEREPVVAVSLGRLQVERMGLGDYLGLHFDLECGREMEVYARKAKVRLELEVFAGKDLGEAALRSACRTVEQAVTGERLFGFSVALLEQGATEFYEKLELFCCKISLDLEGHLQGILDTESGEFSGFQIQAGVV